jgi:prepilin signal peptidase PulO-like enzyme (type II secretory pathway)
MLSGREWLFFSLWLPTLVVLLALLIYDLKWFLLPNKLIVPLTILALLQISLRAMLHWHSVTLNILEPAWGVLIGGGFFYLLHKVSNGKWIGGGDVKLGAALGLLVQSSSNAFLVLFGASLLGTLVSLPLLLLKRVKRDSHIPFGPFLIIAAIVVYFFGASFVNWFNQQFLYL